MPGITGKLIERTQDIFLSFGALGLFVIAFVESIFFPIPPDVVLLPLAVATPELALFYAAVATAGSVMGAIVGYWFGAKGGRPVLEKVASDRNIDRVEDYYDRYGVMAVGIAGFTPIPYKVFAISSGTFKLDMTGFLVASTLSRGARFFLIGGLIWWKGEQIMAFIDGSFGILTLAVAAAAVGAYIVWKRYW
jgi:undecaprenyl-diphosphatase